MKKSKSLFIWFLLGLPGAAFGVEDVKLANVNYVAKAVDHVKNDFIGFEDVNAEDTLVIFGEPGNDNYLGVTRVVDGLREVMGIAKASEVAIGNTGDLTTSDTSSLVAAINEVAANSGGVGDLGNLTTSDQSSVVGAINEVNGNIGLLGNLTTSDQSSVVGAINEVADKVGMAETLTTSDQSSAIAAINEIKITADDAHSKASDVADFIGILGDLTTNDQSSVVAAINEVKGETANIGDLGNLTTSDTSSVVAAINEVDTKVGSLGDAVGNVGDLHAEDGNGSGATDLVTAVNAIADLIGSYSALNIQDGNGSQIPDLVEAINTVDVKLGELTNDAVTTDGSQTLTNKSISGADNTITNLPFSSIASDAVVNSENNNLDDAGNAVDDKFPTEAAVAGVISRLKVTARTTWGDATTDEVSLTIEPAPQE